jgi:uncharacterized protein with HEPN domain
MQRDPRAYLWDVVDAAQSIQTFTRGMDASAYRASGLVQAAVERKFEIIGEALNQLSKSHPELAAAIPDVAQTVAFRNQLIHGYAKVKADTVWSVIQFSLPSLLAVAQSLLTELGSD